MLCVLFSSARAQIDDPETLRALYNQMTPRSREPIYEERPVTAGEYQAGRLSDGALLRALDELNFLRGLAGLAPVSLNEAQNALCQKGAALLAANGEISHEPPRPQDMDEAFYQAASAAAAQSNLARFNWMEESILHQALLGFSRDEGEHNERVLGHRRWLLYPYMKETGFGLANDAQGRSYALMYATDAGNEEAAYDSVCWPSEGCFPVEYLTRETPWSISLNPDVYDLERSAAQIELTELVSGAFYRFEVNAQDENGFCCLAGGRYGDGPVYVFRPELSRFESVQNGYEQNQVWRVTLSGLARRDEQTAQEICYEVRMTSLTPIDPAMVEFREDSLALTVGQTAQAHAQVIPAWADDPSVRWQMEDEEIASVDENGCVTGLREGATRLIARAVNGRQAAIEVTVAPE